MQRTDTLSGGQRQRVAVARALAQRAPVLLADEPVANLDPGNAAEVLGLLRDLARREGLAVLVCLHQPELARRFADRWMRGGRPGRAGVTGGEWPCHVSRETFSLGVEASMMRMDGPVLCFGGPYSNLQATRAVLDEAGRLGIPPSRIVCTGDVVAYCADPAATVDLVMASGIAVVMGNCEENLASGAGDCGCGFDPGTQCDLLSRGWYAHADRQLTPAHRAWMAALPRRLVLGAGGRRLAVLHGGAAEISRFLFASAPDEVLAAEVALTGCDGVIAGHCGLPFTRTVGDALWHNPGAVGMPANDGTSRTWFSVLRPEAAELRIEHRALEYDWAAAATAMRAAGLAEEYASALRSGLWPSLDVLPDWERACVGRAIEPARAEW